MKEKKLLLGILLISIFIFSVGLTYAYFTVTNTGQGSDVTATAGTLNILYSDGPEIIAKGIQPGWTTTKTIKIKNTGTLKAYYSLVWSSLTNEVTNDELILSATCTSDIGTCENVSSQIVNNDIAYGIALDQNEEHTYVITFMFKETGSTQNYNQGKAFNGVLNVLDAIESNTIVGTLLDSDGNPINGATVEMHSTLRTGKTDATGHFEIRGVEVGNHEVTVKNASDVTIATDTMRITSGSSLAVDNKNITSLADKGILNTSIKLSATNTIEEIKVYPSLKDKILSDNTVYADNVSSPYVSLSTGIDFRAKSKLTNGQGLYTNNKLENGKNTYFRGGSFCTYTNYINESKNGSYCISAGGTWSSYKCSLDTDRANCQSKGFTFYDLKNNVTFAGHKWKIIRIDENNNIRMIQSDDTAVPTKINENYNDNAYVGYMYGTTPSTSYINAHTNTNNSTIKTAVDSWYNTNLTIYKNYLSDAGYCNDRSVTSGLGYGENLTEYKSYTRNNFDSTASPRLNISGGCLNASRDLFTTSNSIIGNKSLTNPIGLITIDEARYAGMVYYGATSTQYNFINYLKYGGYFWTMSPTTNGSSSGAFAYSIHGYGNYVENYVTTGLYLRTSIALKPSDSVVSGTGTYDNPYVIQ